MAKQYTVIQRIYCYDAFEESDIPEGMTAAQYAEARYCEETGDPDSHELILIIQEPGKEDVIIYPVPAEELEFDEYATSEDGNEDFWKEGEPVSTHDGLTMVEVDGTPVALTKQVTL
jgi:hypothetical protein